MLLGLLRRRNLTKVSHRLLSGTLLPFTTGLAAVLTVLGVLGPAIAVGASTPAGHGNTARDQEWWLSGLNVTQVWPQSEGAGITVAVLGTGVDTSYPGLAGSVITGPDYTGSGRAPGSPYWGVEGTAVAGIIAAHARGWGLVGVAPAVKILSVRVTLEFNDPLAAEPAISRRLPQAIADGITYATDHGARIIDLPLDPGTLGLTSKGDPAAAGGSPAERAAVGYALSKGVLLVAPAGDDGEGSGIVNYPAAYPGVIAVGAVGRTGQLAPFSSKRPYASLTAPGVNVVAAAPPDSYGIISSTATASGIVAGVAALIMSRFPHLTAAQVTRALVESTANAAGSRSLPPLPARSPAGAGYGTVNAMRAVNVAAFITSASQPRRPAPVVSRHPPVRHSVAAPHHPAASTLAGSVLRDAVAAICALIVLLVVALLVLRSRRNRGDGDRTRPGGQHQHRRPAPAGVVPVAEDALASGPPGPSAGWAPPAAWQGGGIGEIRPAPNASFRSAAAPASKSSGSRTGRGTRRPDENSGPPWEPAPEPRRLIGPLPVASAGPPLPDPGRGIRLPGDMAAPPGAAADPAPPPSFDLTTPPADFDLSTPAFGLTPPSFDGPPPVFNGAPTLSDAAPPVFDAAPPVFGPDAAEAPAGTLPTRQRTGFSAAPVPADYAAPPAEGNPKPARAADPSYIWDLAATDVFPPADATGAAVPKDDGAGLDGD
jgi:subtilisin family serine protease